MRDAYKWKLLASQSHVIQLWEENNFLVGQPGNADQLPVYFNMPADSTVDTVGDKTVRVHICSMRNSDIQSCCNTCRWQ